MGKSPGKWIKAVLFRKKTSKSNSSKRRDITKSSYEKTVLAPPEEPVSSFAAQSLVISEPAPVAVAGEAEKEKPEPGNCEVASVSHGESTISSNQDSEAKTSTNNGPHYDAKRIRLEQAATKVQAAFRGYLASRAFRTLKGIIRLQAVIRGHLVRRQAVSTLYSVVGIVKFQALVRGQMIRLSDVGSEVRGKQFISKRDTGFSDASEVNTCSGREKLLKNAFLRQLLYSFDTAMPLRIRYDPAEPNSSWSWLIRWTMSRVWSPHSEQLSIVDLKQKVEIDKAKPEPSGQKEQSANVENATAHPTSELQKVKRNQRKVSNQQAKSAQKQARDEINKVKHNMKKISNTASEIPVAAEVDTGNPKYSHRKPSKLSVAEFTGQRAENTSDKSTKDLDGATSNLANEVKGTLLPMGDDPVIDFDSHPVSNVQDKQFTDKNESTSGICRDAISKEDQISSENDKIGKRRVSLPAKHDRQETVQRGTRVPSYMAATESAKAKARGQVSPRFGQDVAEKNGLTRRHSLPSSVNSKQSSSPRVQRLTQASGKGVIRIDRSLSSSRDSNVE